MSVKSKSPPNTPLPESVAELQANLRSSYLDSELPKATWLNYNCTLPVEEYDYKLKLCCKANWITSRNEIDVPVQDLFDPVDDIIRPRRIWIEGPAGYGKTSLVWKLARDWAKGEKYMIKYFDLVFVLRKRFLRNQRLAEVLHELCNRHGDLAQTTSSIDLARDKVLLIIDDYSDDDDSPIPDVLDLLRWNKHQEMTVIVTSRTSCDSNKDPDSSTYANLIQKRLLLDGVSSQRVARFLQTNFPDLPNLTIQGIFSHVIAFANKWLGTDICKCPMILLLVAVASLEDTFDVSQTRTEMYATLLNFIIRGSMREIREYPENSSYFTVPLNAENVQENDVLIRVGKLAVHGLLKVRNQFDKRTIASHCGQEALQLGCFVKSQISPGNYFEDTSTYEWLHSTIMEFMAAYYLCFLYNSNKIPKFRNLLKSLWLCCSSKTLVFSFVVGIQPRLAPDLFAALKPWLQENSAEFERMTTILQECNISNALTDIVSSFLPEKWVIGDSNFCRTSVHNTLLDHGLISTQVKRVSWDVSCPLKLRLLGEIPTLTLCGPMSHLDPTCLTGIQCDELCFELKYEDPALKGPRNGWENVVSTTKHVRANRVSFCIDDNADTMLSLLCNQATSGQLQYIKIDWLQCWLLMSKHCMNSLTTLIAKEKVASLHLTLSAYIPTNSGAKRRLSASQITILQESTKSDSYAKKVMRSFIKCIGKSRKLVDLTLITEPKYMQHISMKRLFDKGRKQWKILKVRTLLESDMPENVPT